MPPPPLSSDRFHTNSVEMWLCCELWTLTQIISYKENTVLLTAADGLLYKIVLSEMFTILLSFAMNSTYRQQCNRFHVFICRYMEAQYIPFQFYTTDINVL